MAKVRIVTGFYYKCKLNPNLYPFDCKYTGQNRNVGYVSGRSHEEQLKQLLDPNLLYYLDSQYIWAENSELNLTTIFLLSKILS